MLLGTLGVMENVLQLVVPHLHLPVCVTYFWVHSSTPRPSHSLLQCVLLGLVYGELCRCKAMVGGKDSHLNIALRRYCLQNVFSNIEMAFWNICMISVASYPSDPLHACASAGLVLQQLDQLRINSSQRRGVDLGTAHSLSQWQSCMWAGIYLNQLLCFPLPEPHCARYCIFLHLNTATYRQGTTYRTCSGNTGSSKMNKLLCIDLKFRNPGESLSRRKCLENRGAVTLIRVITQRYPRRAVCLSSVKRGMS